MLHAKQREQTRNLMRLYNKTRLKHVRVQRFPVMKFPTVPHDHGLSAETMNCKTQRSATKECDKSESEKQSCALCDKCTAPISLTSKKSSALLAILFRSFPLS